MTIRSLLRRICRFGGLVLALVCAPVWATDNTIGDTSATSHDVMFCSGQSAPYSGCAAADLRTKADALHTPVAIYEYVRNNYDYALYHGARSGASNTFDGGRGNDVDLAATLIAMLRSQGVPARYVVGTVQIPTAKVVNWLATKNFNLSYGLLRDMGIQSVGVSGDLTTMYLEHVWVEALVPYDNYRGAGNIGSNCVTTPSACNWVPLDPSFKQRKTRSSGIDPYSHLSFDYDSYYKAILNKDDTRKDKNPLEIYQKQVMDWLQANHPGKTLDDIPDYYEIVTEQNGLLPHSLPYGLYGPASSVRRYNSVQDHDDAVTASAEHSKKWNKYVTLQAQIGGVTVPGGVTSSLIDAATQKLTLSWRPAGSGYTGIFRLDGTATGTPVNAGGAATINGVAMVPGAAVKLLLSMDGAPAPDSSTSDYTITATYDGVIGGYYLLATGGETSNWGQVHQAAQNLLAANQQYKIVYNAAESGCDTASGDGCTPYVDASGDGYDASDPKLIDDSAALDALTGGLLQVAGQQYFTKVREKLAELDAINRIRTPIVGFVGMVSSTNSVQYLDGTAFSVQPGGLLIDMKGMTVDSCWRIDQPDQVQALSNSQFELGGHIMSSLEHETWQELTGFDAISTVRGIQIALANDGSLLTPYRSASSDTFPTSYGGYGFSASVPSGWTPHSYSLFGTTYQSWTNGDSSAAFDAIYANSTGILPGDYRLKPYTYSADNGWDSLYSGYASQIAQINAWQAAGTGQLKTNVPFDFQGSTFVGQDVVSYSVASPSGFAVANATRTGSDSYRFSISETAQHPDGIYPVNVSIKLATPSNTITQTFDMGGTVSLDSAPTTSTTGFKVVSYSQPSSSQLTITVQQTASHIDGNWVVPVSATWRLNGSPWAGIIAQFIIPISGGRVITFSGSMPAMNVNTSDTYEIQCQGGAGGALATYTGTPSQLMSSLQGCFNNVISVFNLADGINFFSQPGALIYRATSTSADARPAKSVAGIRDDLYGTNTAVSWKAYKSPSKESTGPSFAFVVDYVKETDTATGMIANGSYLISNQQVAGAGGGYVTAMDTLDTATAFDGESYGQPATISTTPTFDNWSFTNLDLISQVNNNLICTPSTTDPVSTVTGNNFHDETDFTIKGRAGLNYAFTRTYNSSSTATKQDNVGLGNGWTHSYGMRLKSNDYGKCANCTSAQASENGNGKTSSITYTDERGGDHNYLVNEPSYAVTPPTGEFESLVFDTPATGQHTLTFRNGTKYIFETSTGTLKATPGVVARLKQIADPWGNQINLAYDANGRLATVTDNLGIAGRTGLTFAYDAANHLQSITDWTGRNWQYSVVNVGGSPVSYHLASYTNPLAQSISYGYSTGTDSLTTVAKPLQRDGRTVQTTFSYYQNGKTFNYHDALGNIETLDYDLYRKSTRVTDPRGGVREYAYDASGALTRLAEPDGAILLFDNDPVTGLRYTKTDGLGYKTQYSYKADKSFGSASDTFGNVTREQDALNYTVDTTYGPFDQVATVKDKRGTVITTTFHTGSGACIAAGKPNTVTISSLNGVANVRLKSYCWNADGTLASQTDYLSPTDLAKTRVTAYTYDTAAHLNVQAVTVTGWDGTTVTRTYTYDSLGRQTTETLARRTSPTNAAMVNLTTTNTWDALDRVTQVEDALGNRVINRYDANGKVWQVTHQYKRPDASFETRDLVTRTFDAADRVKTETDAQGGVTSTTYDAAGNVTSVTDPENHTLRYEYDAMNRRTSVTDANGRTVKTSYDLAGHPVAVTNGANETVSTAYDKLGRPVSVTDPHGYVSTVGYDANGSPTCLIDANAQAGLQPKNSDGCTVSIQYDELNRPTLTRDALNGVTQTSYDLLGNPLTLTDAEGRQYAWGYDGLGRLTSETDFAGQTTSHALDQAGNVYQRTNRLAEATQTTFDVLDRPTRVDYLKDGSSETLGYDPAGNLASAANGEVGYIFGYDTLNRLQSKLDSRGRSLIFSFDKAGNILTKTTYQGSTTSYTYDGAGTLVSLTNPDYLTVNYQYDDAGRLLARVMSSGARSFYTYDSGGWLDSLRHLDATGATAASQTYTRDRVGNIIGRNVTAGASTGSTSYTLDARYRLTQVDAPGTADDEAYGYDHLGNRLIATRGSTTVGASGTGITSRYSLYTAATRTGNPGYAATPNHRLQEIRLGSPTGALEAGFGFDHEGRLVSQTGSTPRTLAWDAKGRLATLNGETYRYDPSNHRIGRSGGSLGNLDYYLEGEHLESVEQAGTLQEKYFRGSMIDELVAGYINVSGKLTPILFQHDALTSVVAQTKPNGGTLATYAYRPFGENLSATGTPTGRLKYTGREDDGMGLYYYRARYYDKTLGQFVSEDPKGFGAGINFYAYAGNNPINANDPMGLKDVIYSAGPLGRSNPITTNVNVSGTNYLVAGPHGETYPMGAGVLERTVQQGKSFDAVFGVTQTSALVDWGRSFIQDSRLWGASGNASLLETTIQSLPGQPWDTKQYLPPTSVYAINGKVELRDYVGNAIWGSGLNALGISQGAALAGAQIQGALSSVWQEDPRDQEAILFGYSLPSSSSQSGGGLLIYPNKPNTNQMQSVYSK
jgi:RHS repeat-associated protein